MIPYKPMLALPTTGSGNRRPIDLGALATGAWIAQPKLDGIRAILVADGTRCRLYNRNGVDITAAFPEIAGLDLLPIVLDGEIVSRRGTFSHVAARDKMRAVKPALTTRDYRRIARNSPCYFAAFDLLESNGQPLLHIPLHGRLQLMRGVIGNRRNVRPVRSTEKLLDLWNDVVADGGEGIVVKMKKSVYLPGERASSWLKFKVIQSLTVVPIGYEIMADRKTLRTISMGVIDDAGQVVPVGRVGTGWTVAEGVELATRLKASEVFPMEVQALNRTLDQTLRFPVWRGVRTDLTVRDARASQLDTLPFY